MWRRSLNDVVNFVKSLLNILLVESPNGECRMVVVLVVILIELSPSASSACDGMDGGAFITDKDTDVTWLNDNSSFGALMICMEERLFWKCVCSWSFSVNDVSELAKFIICLMDILNRPTTNVELAGNRLWVFIPSSDSCIGVKCEAIDGVALFSKNKPDMVFVDKKSGAECREEGRFSLKSHDVKEL